MKINVWDDHTNTEVEMELDEFLKVNQDGIDEAEAEVIRQLIDEGRRYIGGGGSAPCFVVSPANVVEAHHDG